MKKIKIIFVMVACVVLTCLGADDICSNWPDNGFIGSDGKIVLGEWNSNFGAGKEYAEQHHVPMVLFWANHGCHYCEDLEVSIQNSNFEKWRMMRRLVMIFSYGQCDADKKAAFQFANGSSYPICRIYWVDRNNVSHSKAFTARDGARASMNYQQFADKIDSVLTEFGYDFNTCDTHFVCGNTEFDHLEAQVGKTSYVNVPVARYITDIACTNQLEVTWNDSTSIIDIIWEESVSEQTICVPVATEGVSAGDIIDLTIKCNESVVQTSAITYVDLGDSPANPLWKTERTVDSLEYGEWTCDLDMATNKVATLASKGTEAWTLVYSHGSQWCPYCYLNGKSFVETETFRQWAKDNRIVLVSADMPHNSDSNPDQDWCTIWHRKSEETNLYFDGLGKVPRSGAGYLSRKMIADDEAAAMRAQLKELGTSFLHLPEDYQASRAIIPGMTLIDASGRVVGRLETFDYNMNNHVDGELAGVYCQRLSEMIEGAKTAVDRDSENLNDNCVTTPLSLSLGVPQSCATGSVSHADYRDVYRLDSATSGMQTLFTVKGSRNDAIRLCLLKGDAEGNLTDMIKTVTGNLQVGVSIDTTSIAGFTYDQNSTYFVRVSCHDIMPTTSSNYRPYRLRWGDNEDDATFDGYKANYAGNTLTAYEISAARLFVPIEVASDYMAADGEAMTFSVVGGMSYRFIGIDPPASDFTALDESFYMAKSTKCVTMISAGEVHMVKYQLWRPGVIGFGEGDQRLLERDGGGSVTIVRSGGSSDECNVIVRVRLGSETNVVGRYEFVATNLVWASGEMDAKTVPFKFIANDQYEGEGQFAIELVADSPCSAEIASNVETITMLDTTSPIFEKSSYSVTLYSGFSSDIDFGVINVGTKGTVKLTASKGSDKLPSGMKLSYDKKAGAVTLVGEAKAKSIGKYETEYSITQNKETGYSTTISIEVKNPSDYNHYVATKWSAVEIPMCVNENGTNVIGGLLTVSITAKNKITAKYTDADTSSRMFSGMWSTLDEESGLVSTAIQKGGHVLLVTLSRDGVLGAVLDDGIGGEVVLGVEGDYGEFAGFYTVSLPCVESVIGDEWLGSGYLTLSMSTTSAIAKGRVKFSGVFPNGQSVSGTANLLRVGDQILLPIYKRTSKGVISAMLELSPNGSQTWNSQDDVQAREVVRLAAGYGARFQTRGKEYLANLDVAGSWYPGNVLLSTMIETFYGDAKQAFEMQISTDDGIVEVGVLTANARKLVFGSKLDGTSISFLYKTGIFKGKAKITMANGEVMNGNYAGVLVPGWHKNCDCGDKAVEYPFGAGTFYGKRKINGKSKTASLPVILALPDVE